MVVSDGEIKEFIEAEWANYVKDLRALCEIDSVEDKSHAAAGAPFGPGPRAALDAALDIAKRFGFKTNDGDGYAGFADWKALEGDGKQLGIIGHVDVVQIGEGWSFEPFGVTEKDGCLVGRGVTDDKGPLLSSLYAAKFWKDRGANLGHDIRFIFGSNEETGMGELDYYLEHFGEPDFLFTPDAEFPLCYGEKGLFGAYFKKKVQLGDIVSVQGGASPNAVPGIARAVIRQGANLAEATPSQDIEIAENEDGTTTVTARGIAAHASMPSGSKNAIGVLAEFLLGTTIGNESERAWLETLAKVAETHDGSALGAACADDDFGSLTAVLGTTKLVDGEAEFSVDVRYPTCTTGDELKSKFEAFAKGHELEVEFIRAAEPFLINPESDAVKALMDAYCTTTGRDVKPFTMGGGTYARHFKNAVSFGAADEACKKPDWCGGMHAVDEATTIEEIKNSIAIYIRALGNIAEIHL